ncbi:uncharacterized protein AMSG_02239 [Thecamonas trahens ATCC 50062]|uniref:SANT and BTB domain-containing protein n=1 Tax=Thecamonas trahens ATCC 50062 TaxID=461836 RepID=A0A0L0DVL6_THETB|nr:hypothetical protein AMSG_02239 [Thecamonas trahens ATCC 50062]KNC56270.1 hypothetical protein AMSG_02239 [Thecamonas trahens ATCC 50062]|eukprot:XP_013760789.1 hypothetical protein AMSG_02239 [Thecamonas trahens ATCC 50062]
MAYFGPLLDEYAINDDEDHVAITVHCDARVFRFLIDYVAARDADPNYEPPLSLKNVVSIVVSAAFLGIPPLVHACAHFMAARLDAVLRLPLDLSCLSDTVVASIEPLVPVAVLVSLADPRDVLLPRLLRMRLERELADPCGMLAAAFRCTVCKRVVVPALGDHCADADVGLSEHGELVRGHVRDTAPMPWRPLLKALFAAWRSWPRIYWALYALVHALPCAACDSMFALASLTTCAFHPVAFNSVVYPCCGASSQLARGCASRAHAPAPTSRRDADKLAVLESRSVALAADADLVVSLIASPESLRAAGSRLSSLDAAALSEDRSGSDDSDDSVSDCSNDQPTGATTAPPSRGGYVPRLVTKRAKKMAYGDLVHDSEWRSYLQSDRDAHAYAMLASRVNSVTSAV